MQGGMRISLKVKQSMRSLCLPIIISIILHMDTVRKELKIRKR